MGFAGPVPPRHRPHTAPAADCRSRAGTGRHNVAVITKHAAFEFEVGPSQRGCSWWRLRSRLPAWASAVPRVGSAVSAVVADQMIVTVARRGPDRALFADTL